MGVDIPYELSVECDKCGETITVETTIYPSDGSTYSEMVAVECTTLNENGWTMDGEETFCKECSKEREDE